MSSGLAPGGVAPPAYARAWSGSGPLARPADRALAAVVGAGAMVRSRVPPGQVWAGNPARFVRDLRMPAAPGPARVVSAAEAVR